MNTKLVSAPTRWARPSTAAYVASAFLLGVIDATARRFGITTAEGVGAVCALPLVGLVVGGNRRLFGPTDIPKWIFWVSLVGLAINALPKN
jgi:hypothetical protein